MNQTSIYTGGFPYSREDICYIEVRKDGTVSSFPHRCSCDMTFVEEAHFQAMYKGSRIYATLLRGKHSDLYEVDDLAAFAKAFALNHYAGHTHAFQWSTKDYQDVSDGTSTWVTIKMTCGCLLTERNLEDFAQLVKKQFGWEVVMSGGVSHGTNPKCDGKHFTIEVLSSTLKGKSGKFNLPSKVYLKKV